MMQEAIILAGGLGTRLRSVVQELPKSLAPINEKPFLEYLLDYLINQGITQFIFSVGYKSSHIEQHFGERYKNCSIVYAVEEEPLGTGGGIKFAMEKVEGEHALVVNGDTIFLADVKELHNFHTKQNADVSLALKPLKEFDRYGSVEIENDKIVSFKEKQFVKEGVINGGVYLFNKKAFSSFDLPEKFSIEKDFFEKYATELSLGAFVTDQYFLDIGIPEDFEKAQHEFKQLKY